MYILTIEADHGAKALESHIRNIDDADKLNEYYRYLGCQCIGMVPIDVDGHACDVVCDDEACCISSFILKNCATRQEIHKICRNFINYSEP